MKIKNKSLKELETLSQDIRDRIIDVVSRKGGHFSSTLGAVELTIGMHHVFDAFNDHFIFDVSHQCYPHKLLTNRWEEFETIRQFGGLSGFTKPNESKADYFVAGHSSTSISLAVGAAKAIKLKNESRVPVEFYLNAPIIFKSNDFKHGPGNAQSLLIFDKLVTFTH